MSEQTTARWTTPSVGGRRRLHRERCRTREKHVFQRWPEAYLLSHMLLCNLTSLPPTLLTQTSRNKVKFPSSWLWADLLVKLECSRMAFKARSTSAMVPWALSEPCHHALGSPRHMEGPCDGAPVENTSWAWPSSSWSSWTSPGSQRVSREVSRLFQPPAISGTPAILSFSYSWGPRHCGVDQVIPTVPFLNLSPPESFASGY